MYQVTKKFFAGILKGMTLTEVTGVNMPVGLKTSQYVIVASDKLATR